MLFNKNEQFLNTIKGSEAALIFFNFMKKFLKKPSEMLQICLLEDRKRSMSSAKSVWEFFLNFLFQFKNVLEGFFFFLFFVCHKSQLTQKQNCRQSQKAASFVRCWR